MVFAVSATEENGSLVDSISAEKQTLPAPQSFREKGLSPTLKKLERGGFPSFSPKGYYRFRSYLQKGIENFCFKAHFSREEFHTTTSFLPKEHMPNQFSEQ